MRTSLAAACLIIVAGCSGPASQQPSGGSTTVVIPPASGDTTAAGTSDHAPVSSSSSGSPDASKIVGSWSSASCGERKYARSITLSDGGSFEAEDRVSPCPPKVTCIWSGIVNRHGTYAVQGSQLTLTTAEDKAGAGKAMPFPTSLAIEGGALVEDAGGAKCSYSRR
jgi:hypothetical protein